MICYLSGTITADPKTHSWREEAERYLTSYGIDTLSPLRGKDLRSISEDGLTSNIPGSLFCARDLEDVAKSDVMLIYVPMGLDRQSIGTWAEFGWAIWAQIPVIMVVDVEDDTTRFHPFVQKWASFISWNLTDALEMVRWMR